MLSARVFQVPSKLITGMGSSRKVETEIKKLNLHFTLHVPRFTSQVLPFTLIISTLFLLSGVCIANVYESKQVFDFANSLFDEGDYKNAINEYNRYLYFYPDGSFALESQYRIAACYLNMKEFSKAIKAYQKILKMDIPDKLQEKTKSKIAECYLFKKDYNQAIEEFNRFLTDYPQSDFVSRAQFMLGATYTEVQDWDMAEKAWRKIYSGTQRAESQLLRDETRNLTRLLRQADKLPRRSPVLSGIMSTLLPGLGQTYCERLSDGVYTFLVVGSLFAGTAYYARNERYKIAVPLGIVSSIFYAGNIYGGVRAAKVFNYEQKSNFLKMLKEKIREIGKSGELEF